MNKIRKSKGSLVLAVAAIASMVGALSACSTTETTDSAKSKDESSVDAYYIALNKCLREQGIEVTTEEKTSSGGQLSVSGGDAEAMDKANAICEKKLGAPPQSTQGETLKPEDAAKLAEETLRQAKCLRDNGVEAEVQEGGFLSYEPEVPEAALKACSMAADR